MLQSFTVSLLCAPSWWAATWPSTANKIARNKLGTFYLAATASNDPVGGTSTNFTLFWDRGDNRGPLPISSGALPTNMCCLEAFESGEVHIIYSDWGSGGTSLVDICWPNMAASAAPIQPTVNANFSPAGKIGSVVDDARRCIHVVGLCKNYAKLDARGALISQQALFKTSTLVAEYFSLTLDDASNLHVTWCNATSASPPHYDSVIAMSSPNPGDLQPAWSAGEWGIGPTLTPPIDPLGGVWMTLGEQERRCNNLMVGSTFFQGRLHALIAQTPAASERFYATDDFSDLTVEVVSMPWAGPTYLIQSDAIVHRPLRGETLHPKCASGAVAGRGGFLYAITHDRMSLLALRSADNGESWHDYAQTSLAPYLGAGSGPSGMWTPRDLGVYRGSDQDSDIIGAFTVMQCSPSEFANGPAGFNPPCSTYSFSLPVA
jgi:hypothetical protein